MAVFKEYADFENPNNVPLEELKFKITKDGVIKEIPAFSPHWVEPRCHAVYPGPMGPSPADLEQWLSEMKWFNEELVWMLQLEHFRFWSYFCTDRGCITSIISFLQEAPPFYSPFTSENQQAMDAFASAYENTLRVCCRLVTNKESESAWMNKSFLSQKLYSHYLISIPMLWDITILYGRSNRAVITRFLDTVFRLEPRYTNDLKSALAFLKDTFRMMEAQVTGQPAADGSSVLPLNGHKGPPKAALCDLALHLLDCAATLSVFLELYPQARVICRDMKFNVGIAQLYDSTIPKLFNNLSDRDDSMSQLNHARVELLQAYYLILYTCMEEVLDNPSMSQAPSETFMDIISECLEVTHGQKDFLTDLQSLHPIQEDLVLLRQASPQLDSVKYDFILQSLLAAMADPDDVKYPDEENISIGFNPTHTPSLVNIDNSEGDGAVGMLPQETEPDIAITEVLEVLPHLGAGYVSRLLKHFGSHEKVITAVLEGSIPDELACLDPSEPLIPVDPADTLYLETGIRRNNIFDGDDYDIMTHDVPKEAFRRKGGKGGPRNIKDLLNDKSHVREMSERYREYSLVPEENNVYDDEFDDSYDGPVTQGADEGPGSKRRPYEVPRVLQQMMQESESEDEVQEVPTQQQAESSARSYEMFCENPEAVRARYEASRNIRTKRDVVGKTKGQGQEKEVVVNRDKKNTNKSSRANHNRRQGAAWKHSRGMMPF